MKQWTRTHLGLSRARMRLKMGSSQSHALTSWKCRCVCVSGEDSIHLVGCKNLWKHLSQFQPGQVAEVAFIHVGFFVINMVCSGKFSWASFQNWFAYRVLVWVELFKHSVQWGLIHVSHGYALTQVNVPEGVDVNPLLIGGVLVQAFVKFLPWSPRQAFNEFFSRPPFE